MNMKNTEIYQNIEKILKNELASEMEIHIKDDTNLIEDYSLSSMMVLELMIELELFYSIEIEEDEFDIETLSEARKIADLINKKIE